MERRIQNKFIKSAYSDSGLVNKFSPRVVVVVVVCVLYAAKAN